MTDVQNTSVTVFELLPGHSDRSGMEVTSSPRSTATTSTWTPAALSALLGDQFGSDPFGAGLMPETVPEIVEFYGASDASASA
jgi:acyl carrier protein